MRRQIKIPVVRALIMLGLGSGGMTKELFFVPSTDMDLRVVWVCIGLMLGPAVLEAAWRAWAAAARAPEPETPSSAPLSS